MECETRAGGGDGGADEGAGYRYPVGDAGAAEAAALNVWPSWRVENSIKDLMRRVDKLEGSVDRLGLGLEKLQQRQAEQWLWMDEVAAPIIRYFRRSDEKLGAVQPHPPIIRELAEQNLGLALRLEGVEFGLQALARGVEQSRTDAAELAHELQRVVAAVERLSSLGAERPK